MRMRTYSKFGHTDVPMYLATQDQLLEEVQVDVVRGEAFGRRPTILMLI